MDNFKIVLFVFVGIFYVGSIAAYIIFGQTKSISSIYNEIIKRFGEDAGIFFTVWFLSMGFLSIFLMLEVLKDSPLQFLGWTTGFGLALVGAAPNYKEENQKKVHTPAAIVAAISIIIAAFSQLWLYEIILLVIAVIIQWVTAKKDYTFWGEHAVFLLGFIFIYIGL